MPAPRLLTASALALAMLLTGLLAVPASAASEFAAVGCFNDPSGDAGGVDAVDLTEVCLNHRDSGNITITVATVAALDPVGDPAWRNDGTALSVMLSIDGDPEADFVLTLRDNADGAPAVFATDGDDQPVTCEVAAQPGSPTSVVFLAARDGCLGNPDTIRVGSVYTYEQTEGQAVAMDRLPDAALSTLALPAGDTPPFCDNHSETGDAVVVARLRCGGIITSTEPITQGVAVSQFVFDVLDTPVIEGYQGRWAVIVRDDNFADALAGSSLGFGQGPLLFTSSPTSAPLKSPPADPGRLAQPTEQELLRTLPRGFPVYVLGGTAAIDEGVVNHLTELGYDAIRLAGAGREETAANVARETRRLVADFAARNPGFPDTNMVLIANSANWPDAVLAGQIGALWGMPILLTSATGAGHPATLAALEEIRPDAIQFIGGNAVITSDTLNAIRDFSLARGFAMGRAGEAQNTPDRTVPWRQFCARSETEPFWACRQGGDTRLATAAAVSQFGREMIQRFGGSGTLIPDTEVYASAVPLAGGVESNNYAYVLAASMMSGRFGGAVFLPTDQEAAGNQRLTDTVKASVCALERGKDTNGDGQVDTPFIELVELVAMMAGDDKLNDAFGEEIRGLIQNGCPPEFQGATRSLRLSGGQAD